jgi:hypothetical protein
MGVRSSRCTNAGACIPLRLNFTRNLVFFMGGLLNPFYSDNRDIRYQSRHYLMILWLKAAMGPQTSKIPGGLNVIGMLQQ